MLIKSAKDKVKDFINNNPKTSFLLMDTLLKGGVSLGQASYIKHLIPKLAKEDVKAYDSLMDLGLKKGIIEDVLEGTAKSNNLRSKVTANLIEKPPFDFKHMNYYTDNAYFDPKLPIEGKPTKAVLNMLGKKPGLLAHELGHAEDYANKDFTRGYNLGNRLSGIGNLATAIAAMSGADDNTLLAMGAGSSLLEAPVLRGEFVASKNGYKMLRKLGHGRLKSLAAFVGLPTYMVSNLSKSFAPYIVRKCLKKLSGKSDS